MHGRNLDEHVWNDETYLTALIQSEWQRRPELPPRVVTISDGSTWLLTPKGKTPDSGLLDDLMARLSAIEGKVGRLAYIRSRRSHRCPRLADVVLKRGVKTEWHPLYGGHCVTDAASLAAFLSS